MKDFIKKYYYGDIPDDKAGGNELKDSKNPPSGGRGADWPLWEVFIRSKQGLDHKHVGSLHATDAQMAIENARDAYTRRMEGVSIWVVESKYIHASILKKQENYLNLPLIKFIVTQLFMICLMK